jgi:dTDP-glucose 4,6-dehydratase
VLAALGLGEDRIEMVTDRPGHDRRYSITSEKVRALGWAPTLPFEERLEQTVRWYVDNEWWWQPLRSRVKNR